MRRKFKSLLKHQRYLERVPRIRLKLPAYLPNWKVKVTKKKVKEMNLKEFNIKQELEETIPPLSSDMYIFKNPLISLKRSLEDLEFSHLNAYKHFARIPKSEWSNINLGAKNLYKLLFNIADSDLRPEIRLERSQNILLKYQQESIPLTGEVYIALAKATRHAFKKMAIIDEFTKQIPQNILVKCISQITRIGVQGFIENGFHKNAELLFNRNANLLKFDDYVAVRCLLFDNYLERQDLENAFQQIKALKQAGNAIGPWMGNKMLNACAKLSYFKASVFNSTIKFLQSERVGLTYGMYKSILITCHKFNLLDLEKWRREIANSKINLEKLEFDIEIQSLLKQNKYQAAEELSRNELPNQNYLPDHTTWSSFTAMFIRLGSKLDKVKQQKEYTFMLGKAYFYQMYSMKLHAYCPPKTLLALMRLYIPTRNCKRVLALFLQSGRRGFKHTEEHYFNLIDSYCHFGSVIRANMVVRDMYQHNIKPSTRIFNRIIEAYLDMKYSETKKPHFDKAFVVLGHMVQLNVKIDENTHRIFSSALYAVKDVGKSLEWLQMLMQANVSPHILMFNHMIRIFGCTDRKSIALRYLEQMKKLGIQPNNETYEYLIDMTSSCHDCLNLWTEAIRKGVQHTCKSCIRTLLLLGDSLDIKNLIKVYSEMDGKKRYDSKVSNAFFSMLIKLDSAEIPKYFNNIYKERRVRISESNAKKLYNRDKWRPLVMSLLSSQPFIIKPLLGHVFPIPPRHPKDIHSIYSDYKYFNFKYSFSARQDARKWGFDGRPILKNHINRYT